MKPLLVVEPQCFAEDLAQQVVVGPDELLHFGDQLGPSRSPPVISSKEIFGYSPRVAAYQGQLLALLLTGRLYEARRLVKAAQEVAEVAEEHEVLSWVLWTTASLAYAEGAPSMRAYARTSPRPRCAVRCRIRNPARRQAVPPAHDGRPAKMFYRGRQSK
jgi:hypothetical protein